MIIKFDSEKEFRKLLDALASELTDANIHWRLYKDLRKELNAFQKAYTQSPAFWYLTIQAHFDSVIFRLIRIYDQNSSSLSICNLLDTIKANLHIFEIEKFRERMKDNQFVESLAAYSRRPDEKQLDEDIEFSKNGNMLVRNLSVLRGNLLAHVNARNVVKGTRIEKLNSLNGDDIDKLLEKGMEIFNHYKQLFCAESHSTQILGHDDYKFIFKSIKIHLEKINSEIDEQFKLYGINRTKPFTNDN